MSRLQCVKTYSLVTLHSVIVLCTREIGQHGFDNGPLTRYAKLWVVHAPGMPGTFSPAPRIMHPDMHYDTCVTHVP